MTTLDVSIFIFIDFDNNLRTVLHIDLLDWLTAILTPSLKAKSQVKNNRLVHLY